MIVAKDNSWSGLVFYLRGSVLGRIWFRMLATTVISLTVTFYEWKSGSFEGHLTLTTTPFSLIGVALGIFLGFRNNNAYDRFWEGRKLWGRMVNVSRTWTRQVLTLIVEGKGPERGAPTELQRSLIYRQMAYVHTFRMHLRGEKNYEELEGMIDEAEREKLKTETNPPNALAQRTGDILHKAWREGKINDFHLPVLEGSLTEMLNVQGGCERIKATPVPFGYVALLHRITGVYCFLLPFGIVGKVGLLTPLVVLFVSYAFFALDAIGSEVENPFGYDANDLPISMISRMIEINLRERLEETDLPEAVKPVKGVIS